MDRFRRHLPNALSVSRLLLGLLFVFFPHNYRLIVVILAGLTDFLDGTLARRWNVRSEFGRIIDPIADRTFAAAMALTFLFEARLTGLELVLIGIRDIVVIVGALAIIAVGRRDDFQKIKTRIPGKAATVIQFAFLITILLFDSALWAFVLITALFSAVAAVDYIWFYFQKVLPAPIDTEEMA